MAVPAPRSRVWFFFFNDTATTEIYTLSLHDALPILRPITETIPKPMIDVGGMPLVERDRKSTRLNSSHGSISYAVFCLNKTNKSGEGLNTEPTKPYYYKPLTSVRQ